MFWTYDGKDVGQLYEFDTLTETYSKITTFSTSIMREPDVVTSSGPYYDADASNYASLGLTNKKGETVTTAAKFKELIEEDFTEMKASIEKGYYQGSDGSTTTTGSNPAYAVNNIYDMAGN